jgi:serine/threonine protein kinase
VQARPAPGQRGPPDRWKRPVADTKQHHFSRGDVISRRYEIERELGSGLVGTTYLARHISTGKPICLKVLRAGMVIKLEEVGYHEGAAYFTEEYFESQNLRQLIDEYQAEQRSFTLQEACQIATNVLDAVAGLHDAEVVHRNLKPENVLVQSRHTGPGGKNIVRTVKVTDGGLAEMIRPQVFAQTYINRSEARYLAPEMGGFDQAGSPSADIYSVGVMLYELLVGQPPRGTYLSPTQLRGDLPEHIDDVVELALGANPEDRYPSARDMINDIQRSFSGEMEDVRTGPNIKRIAIAVGAALAVLGLAGAYLETR